MLKLDPRTCIILLVIANAVIFIQRNIAIEIIWVGLLLLLLCICGAVRSAVKLAAVFTACIVIQYFVFPVAPKSVVSIFFILISYARKVIPCLIVGTLTMKTVTVRELTAALLKWKVPYSLIIPLSVSIRYFPAIKEEIGYIRDAMKLRSIRFTDKFECMIVPIMMSATTTSDELSAAAVTRGIENPCKKTSIIDIRFGIADFVCIAVGVLFIALAVIFR
ncbi:energy-coupling factor transporter transmembrane component T [Ruminococcus sp.]|uniref:energy-coupling factor transporter transmembrane component T n=1 Tax=Ruminococcus sp. TaxID=41978 RepID=UPI002CA4DB5C|nr:energy-coupling factor transporter transmembrane component T [Ruminococcus sp.]HOA00420.1 energy-coupling factor transporter transmembrane component T [Ruminococcus sp.]